MENIGKMLKEKRLELGLSIDDISEKTRLTPKHVKALEEGDMSFFHEDLSYLRFFVKSYCEAVNIDFEDVKDELRESIDDYTTTFLNKAELTHQEIEKNVSRSERLSRVQSSDTGRRSLRIQKPDVSLVSLVAIIGVVAIIILFAFVIFLKIGNKNDDLSQKQPVAPIQNEVGENVTEENSNKPSSDNSGEKEEMEIVAGDDATHFFLTNVKDGDKLKVDTAFNGSNSGYSVTIINDGNEEVRNNEVYNMGQTASTEVEVKKGTKINVYVGCMYQTEIKINDKVVKLDSSVNPSTWTGSCTSYTFEFTVGDQNESSK